MMTVALPEDLESQLHAEASRHGMQAVDYAVSLIRLALPAAKPPKPEADQVTLDLLARWDAEDRTDDPVEIQRRNAQWEEFRRSMNEHSLSDHPVYP